MQKCKIKSVKYMGKRKTYNLTMKSDQHNYFVFDKETNKSVVSKNSHSCCYGYNSYVTAYLKANYPDEFICSLLDITINISQGERYEKIEAFEKEFKRKMGIKFLPRDINKSKVSYIIEKRKDLQNDIKKTEIRPSLLCKGLGFQAATEIENNQLYDNMKDLVEKTDSSIVDTRSVESLILGGYFVKKAIEKVDEMVKDFIMIREDAKKTAKKGIESVDLFG